MKELSHTILEYATNRKAEYEKKYHIQVLMWFVRKSFLRGLERSTSDLDIVFIFQSLDSSPKKILFERAMRRIEIQCWNIQDIIEIIKENKIRSMQKESEIFYKQDIFKHYILDYYHGFYIGWESHLMQDCYGFQKYCGQYIWNLYEPLVAVQILYLDLIEAIDRVKTGYLLSLNQYINAIWAGMAGCHLLNGSKPCDIDTDILIPHFLQEDDARMFHKMVGHFKQTYKKQSNYCNLEELNQILEELKYSLEENIQDYEVKNIDVDGEIKKLEMGLKKVMEHYKDESC